MAHWVTNRGKLLIAQGDWDDAAAGDYLVGLIKGASLPTSMDTEAEVQDLNFVSELLALSGVTEADFTNYARTALTRVNAAEDDTNNRVGLDASNVSISPAGGATNNTLVAGFIYKTGASDAARQLFSVFTFATPFPTNGSGLDLTINDAVRLT